MAKRIFAWTCVYFSGPDWRGWSTTEWQSRKFPQISVVYFENPKTRQCFKQILVFQSSYRPTDLENAVEYIRSLRYASDRLQRSSSGIQEPQLFAPLPKGRQMDERVLSGDVELIRPTGAESLVELSPARRVGKSRKKVRVH